MAAEPFPEMASRSRISGGGGLLPGGPPRRPGSAVPRSGASPMRWQGAGKPYTRTWPESWRPGGQAEHALIVTAVGFPRAALHSRALVPAGPARRLSLGFHAACQASPASLEVDGRKLNVAGLRFDLHVENDRDVIDTVVFHPAFAQMPPEARGRSASPPWTGRWGRTA